MSAQNPFLVFSGTNSRYLADKICNNLGCPLGQMNIQHFADGEFSVSYEESIRGRDVFLVQSTFPNSDNLMELLLMIDAAKRASAHSIIAVIPYFGWARQDRKDKPRVSIAAKLIADMSTLSRRFGCEFKVESNDVLKYHYTLKTQSSNLNIILNELEKISPVKFKTSNKIIIVYK